MSTAGNQRVTRSASKTRSAGAGSAGAPSVGASSRARSRRVGSTAPLPEEDKPTVGNQATRAYGTEGKSAQAQLLSAQIGMNQAINPIANAVSKAQAPETPIANPLGRLPVVDEEPEDREGSHHTDQILRDRLARLPNDPNRRPYSIDSTESEPTAQQSFFSRYFWAPRRDGFNAEGPNRTSNNVIASTLQGRRYADDAEEIEYEGYPPGLREYHFVYPWGPNVLFRDGVVILMLLFGILWIYEANRTSLFSPENYSVDLARFLWLEKHVTRIERRVDDFSRSSMSADAAAAAHQINWFTPGFGTSIDVDLSSPTASDCDPTWTPSGWPWSMFKSQTCPQVSLSESHFAALSAWSDPVDDSWCAPPSNGKLQLTVLLGRNIAPTELVVEHAAMDEMPAGLMGSSPREVELWIQVPDDTIRAALIDAITRTTPSLLQDSSPQGKTLGDDQALPFDFVPVGRWEYNIRANRRIQTFPIPVLLKDDGIGTAKVAVRVNSNWGNVKSTCLSRLRLHGEDVSGVTEALE